MYMMGFDEVKSRLTHLETDRHEMTHDPPADVIRSPHSLRSTPLYEAKYSSFIRFSTFSISVIKAHRPSIFLKARGVACSCYIRLMLETQSCRRTLYNTMKFLFPCDGRRIAADRMQLPTRSQGYCAMQRSGANLSELLEHQEKPSTRILAAVRLD
jgi:hypothetical protein